MLPIDPLEPAPLSKSLHLSIGKAAPSNALILGWSNVRSFDGQDPS